MINLRTEYSFRYAFGHMREVIDATGDEPMIGICDRASTFGHFKWDRDVRAAGKKPVFGVELACVEDASLKMKRGEQGTHWVKFIARNNSGLEYIYNLVRLAMDNFHYIPRLDESILKEVPQDVIILAESFKGLKRKKNVFASLSPGSKAPPKGIRAVATQDNNFPLPQDRAAYQICMGELPSGGKKRISRWDQKPTPQHILSEWEWKILFPKHHDAWELSKKLMSECEVTLPEGDLVIPDRPDTLEKMCLAGAKELGLKLDSEYKARLKRELDIIKEKKFEDYFYLISDLCRDAKQKMLVGPGRGSSAGSLVCYLLGITTVDPVPNGLLFERFIDINRPDLPDIDIDFQDSERHLVFEYLGDKYGHECVARLGTVNRMMARSAVGNTGKLLRLPFKTTEELKDTLIERSPGDERAFKCVEDTLIETDIGRSFLNEYPEIEIAGRIEGHASHAGQHAAGVLVTPKPVTHYGAIDSRVNAIQMDYRDAESLGLLKIDCLGLRTLSVIQDCLDMAGKSREWLFSIPLDDQEAFDVLNKKKWSGIFQFEGQALNGLTQQIKVDRFSDLVALTSLARPGPLRSGSAERWIKFKNGEEEPVELHPIVSEITSETFGEIVYQEQIMKICRELAGMRWPEVSLVRRAIGKSMGREYMAKFEKEFIRGARRKIKYDDAQALWDGMCEFGAYSFNKSHAYAYSIISYYCMYLKAHFPFEFIISALRHSNDETAVPILKEAVKAGYEIIPVSEDSDESWTAKDGKILGGFTGVKGIGPKTAAEIVLRRKEGRELTNRQKKLLTAGETPWDNLFPLKDIYDVIYENQEDFLIAGQLRYIDDIHISEEGVFMLIGRFMGMTVKEKFNQNYGLVKFEDDSGTAPCIIHRGDWARLGVPMLKEAVKEKTVYLVRAGKQKGSNWMAVKNVRIIGDLEKMIPSFEKISLILKENMI